MEDARDAKKTEKVDELSDGDKISITYTNYQKNENESSVEAPYVEIIK